MKNVSLRIGVVVAASPFYTAREVAWLHDVGSVAVVVPAVLLMLAAGRLAETLEGARHAAA